MKKAMIVYECMKGKMPVVGNMIITLALAIGVVLWSLCEIQPQNDNAQEKFLKERRKHNDNRKN